MHWIARFSCWLVVAVLQGWSFPSLATDAGLHGAGATFPFPVYAKWADAYQRETGTVINYDPVGSGTGIDLIERRQVDFGASDVPLTTDELQRIGVWQFPVVVGGVVPVVNIAGLKPGELRLTGQVLADIYLGKLRKWDAPAIAALNPGLSLPSTNITVVHRSDSSGTTFLWSSFLARSSPEWSSRVGVARLLAWPVGVADMGNEGLASTVQRTRNSIGYVEFAYAKAHHLNHASVRNRNGAYVQPGATSFNAAAQAASWQGAPDLNQLLIDEPGAASWPLTGASFILVPAKSDAADRNGEVMKFFGWALKHGQPMAISLDYAPMPEAAVGLIEHLWAASQP